MTNLRRILTSVGLELHAKSMAAGESQHKGGRGMTRESDFARTLGPYLPSRYSIGSGEICNSHSLVSKQCDVVLFNEMAYPKVLSSPEHSVFPVESIYGVVEVKSVLGKADLRDAFANAASVRKMIPDQTFAYTSGQAPQSHLRLPLPVYGIFSYAAGRSQSTVAEQIKSLCLKHPSREWPDFIACLDEGIYLLNPDPRTGVNQYDIVPGAGFGFYRAERMTLFRIYAKLLSSLGRIVLPPMDFAAYANRQTLMVGPYRVRSYSMWDPKQSKLMEFTEKGIAKILQFCSRAEPISLQAAHEHETDIPLGFVPDAWKAPRVHEYNPARKPALPAALFVASAQAQIARHGDPSVVEPDTSKFFTPVKILIDDRLYHVDFDSLVAGDDYKHTEHISENEFNYGLHI